MRNHLMIWLVIVLVGCNNKVPNEDSVDSRLDVVATTGMLYDAVINIGKDKVSASAIMGPGVDPHLYKATQGDLRKLQKADLIIYNGLFLEGKMAEILEKQSKIRNVTAAAEGIDKEILLASEDYENAYDPHVWFDVTLWKEVVTQISISLSEVDSANTKYYQANLQHYLLQLDSLDQFVLDQLATIPPQQRLLITAHDAFGYYGRAYDLEVKGIQGISTLSDFGLRDIALLTDIIIDRKVKALFVETSVSNKAIEALIKGCKEKGHNVDIGGYLYSDAMGSEGTIEGTYIGMVKHNTITIAEALK